MVRRLDWDSIAHIIGQEEMDWLNVNIFMILFDVEERKIEIKEEAISGAWKDRKKK